MLLCAFYMVVGTTRVMVTLQGQKITRVEQHKLWKAGIMAGEYVKLTADVYDIGGYIGYLT